MFGTASWWTSVRVAIFVLVICVCVVPSGFGQATPALPTLIDTTFPTQTGATINVPSGGNLQTAIDNAQLGDTIMLQAGATFSGTFTLKPKTGTGWIVIRTSAPDSSIPAPGNRITPSYASVLPKIVANTLNPAFQTAAGAHHYRLVGLEVTVAAGVGPTNYGLIQLGTSTTSQAPYSIVLDRLYIHGLPTQNVRRGVALNSATSAVLDSYISEIHEVGADAQAICGWNGPGPFKIINNFLSAATENVMFGGADPAITNLVPSDIEIRGNHFFKPTAWRGGTWVIKNLLEFKNARRVLVDGNILEYNWRHAQSGYAVLFTPRNQDGTAPWSTVEDITFTHNIIRHTGAGLTMLGTDDIKVSQSLKRVLVANNVFDDVNGTTWGGPGDLFQFTNNVSYATVDHNTVFQTRFFIWGESGIHTNIVVTNNIAPQAGGGVAGNGKVIANDTLATYFPGAVFRRNAIQGGTASNYPADNFFPPTMNDVQFVNFSGGDYRLASTSPYKNAGTDGKDVGADVNAVNTLTQGVIPGIAPGTPPPPPPPPPTDTTPPTVSITTPLTGVTVSGVTTVSANASDNTSVAGVQFFVDGTALGTEITASPYTMAWDTRSILNGAHTLTARARDGAGNTTTTLGTTVTVSNVAAVQAPFTGTPFPVPGQFEAEDFDKGGEGVAYHDVVAGNAGGLYRTAEDVDIISPYAGGYAVNNFQTGEWLEYSINVTSTANLRVEALVSSGFATSKFHIEIDGVNKTGSVSVPNTGAWTTFQWIGGSIGALTTGVHILRLSSDVEYFNVDRIRVSLDPDLTPPSVTITGPTSGSVLVGSIPILATASDNIGVSDVQFYVDGSPLGAADTTPPFGTTWNTTTAANGSHTLTATARDSAGNSTTSAPVTVTVSNVSAGDTTPPTVSITSPIGGATVGGTVSMTASASDNVAVAGVQFYADGTAVGAEVTAAPYTVAWTTTALANGSHTLTAVARDAAGNATTSLPVIVLVSNTTGADTIPPRVAITAPTSGASVTGIVLVTATASDNVGVVGVRFQVDGFDIGGEDTTSPYEASWITGALMDGAYSLTAIARDAAGNSTTSVPVKVTVYHTTPDTTAPTVTITSPMINETVAGMIQIAATAMDDIGVAGVRFYVDGVQLAVEDTSVPYGFAWDTTRAANGTHILTAVVRDLAGNIGTSAGVPVNVANGSPDTTPPVVSLITPADNATVGGIVSVSASASDNEGVAGVQFYLDGLTLGLEETAPPYSVTWDTSTATTGSHVLTAIARDVAGNSTTSAPVHVTVTNGPGPYTGTPYTLPGRFEAENFDRGGEGVAYHDTTPGNEGGFYRTSEDVDIINPYANGYVVNNFRTGEWLNYTVSVADSGTYRLEVLASSGYSGTRFHIEIDGVNVTGTVVVPYTGSWSTFNWVGVSGINIAAGTHTLRVVADSEYFNLDAISSTLETSSSPRRRAAGR